MTRKCRHCRAEMPPKAKSDHWQRAGFCDVGCMAAHGLEKARQAQERKSAREAREKRRQEREKRRELRKRKEAIKTKAERLNDLQAIVNRYVRLRDAGKPCCSCGKPDDGTHQRHASHYRSVKACSALRFHTLNIHASCAQCNTHLSGNAVEYRIRLVDKLGEPTVLWLESQNQTRRYSDEWIERAKRVFRKKIRRVEKKRESAW